MATEVLPLLLLVAGFVLIVLEAFAPGAHFVVLGVALFVAGLFGITFGALASPIALAALVLLVGIASFLVYRELDFYGSEAGRTSDSSSLKGQTGRVTEAVSTSGGEIKLEDGGFNPFYQARTMSGEIEVGEEVMVLDPGGGNVLTVEPTGPGRDELDRQLDRDAATKDAESSQSTADEQRERERE
jgi:membrane protein implicated in regulation of membrane protease activity